MKRIPIRDSVYCPCDGKYAHYSTDCLFCTYYDGKTGDDFFCKAGEEDDSRSYRIPVKKVVKKPVKKTTKKPVVKRKYGTYGVPGYE